MIRTYSSTFRPELKMYNISRIIGNQLTIQSLHKLVAASHNLETSGGLGGKSSPGKS